MRIALTVAYDGTRFHGFQRQREEPTVQSCLEDALRTINGTAVVVRGAGRTDAGVHAFAQVVCFDPDVQIPLDRWPVAMNGLLPEGIWVKGARLVPGDFDPVGWASWKHYRYRIRLDDGGLPFLANFAWYLMRNLDLSEMERAARGLEGVRDFASFQVSGRPVKSTVRNMHRLVVTSDQSVVSIDMIADGFLYKMARSIVGTLVEVGLGRITPEDLWSARDAGDRSAAGPTAPGHGLFLIAVGYPPDELPAD